MNKVDWMTDAAAAFELARNSGRPLFLYWGAQWCPPCNRIKGTVFADPAFAHLGVGFVALHVDGDSPGAQALAERLHVRSYPTLVLYRPDGAEVMRLACELPAPRFVAMLALALSAPHTVAASLQAALAHERALGDDEWRLLAAYSWDTDEGRLLQGRALHVVAAQLRDACTVPEAAVRFDWLALHAAAQAGAPIDQAAAIARVQRMLAERDCVHAAMDFVTNDAASLLRYLAAADPASRSALAAQWTAALALLEADRATHLVDRSAALRTRLRLGGRTGQDHEAAVTGWLDEDGPAAHPAVRHQLVNTAAGVLAENGQPDAAARLLDAELLRSHAPYYFMHTLASLARKAGDSGAALDWYERAWQGAPGAATRLQWGATYLCSLLELAPDDATRIDRIAGELCAALAQTADAHSQRNRTQCERIASALAQWPGQGEHTAALRAAVRS